MNFWNDGLQIDELHFVEPNYFVIIYNPRDCTEGTFLILMSINFKEMTCSHLDDHFLEQMSQPKITFDNENSRRFIVRYCF